MHSFPLSKEQARLLQDTQHSRYNLIEYHDHDKAMNSILALTYHQICQQKSVLIVAADHQEAAQIEQDLKTLQLDKFLLADAYENEISEYQASQWRNFISNDRTHLDQKIRQTQLNYHRSKEKYSKLHNQLKSYYYQLKQPVLGSLAIEQLSHAVAIKRIPENLVYDLNRISPTLFEKNIAEWTELSSIVKQAINLYKTDHRHIKPLLALNESYLSKKSIDDLVIELKNIIATLSEARLYYKGLLIKYASQLQDYFRTHITAAQSSIDNLLAELHTIEQNFINVPSTLSTEIAILNEHLSKLNTEGLDTNLTSGQLSGLKSILVQKKDELETSQKLIHKRIKLYSDRVRTEDIAEDDQNRIVEWNKKLTDYSKIITAAAERLLPTESIKRKLDKIQGVIELFETQLHVTNVYPSFIKWQQYRATQKPAYQLLLDSLLDKPLHLWCDITETWYYQMCIANKSKREITNFAPIQRDMKAARELSALQLELLELSLADSRNTAINSLKQNNPELYKGIFRKKLEANIPLDELLLSTDKLIAEMYPIVVITNAQLASLSYAKRILFDTLIFQDPELINRLDLSTFQLANTLYIFSPVSNRLSKNEQLKPYFSQGKIIALREAQIPTIDQKQGQIKVSVAKKIAKVLLSMQEEISIYHSKNHSIISCCTGTFATLTRQIITESGVKELYGTQSKEDRLVEALLSTDKEQFIVVQDGLINPAESDYIKHQLELIATLSKLRFNFVDLWTDDALQTHHRKNIQKLKAIKTPILAAEKQSETSLKKES